MLQSKNNPVTVVKLNVHGKETFRYEGHILHRDKSRIVLEAFFNRDDMDIHGLMLCKGDRFLETYYTDRWYNIFEIHSRADDSLRGWYCNVSSPARLEEGMIRYVDLALDLLVFPDGRQVVLDEDEFSCLELNAEEKEQAISALSELRAHFTQMNRSYRGLDLPATR